MILLALVACGEISRSETEDLLDANVAILGDIDTRLDTIETKLPEAAALLPHGQGDGDYEYDGVLDASGTWSGGTITILGTGSSRQGGSIVTSQLHLVMEGVDVDGVVIDGEADAALSLTIQSGVVAVQYDLVGTEECSGRVTGTADLDFTMSANGATGGAPTYTGTVNGRDVSKL